MEHYHIGTSDKLTSAGLAERFYKLCNRVRTNTTTQYGLHWMMSHSKCAIADRKYVPVIQVEAPTQNRRSITLGIGQYKKRVMEDRIAQWVRYEDTGQEQLSLRIPEFVRGDKSSKLITNYYKEALHGNLEIARTCRDIASMFMPMDNDELNDIVVYVATYKTVKHVVVEGTTKPTPIMQPCLSTDELLGLLL